MADLAGVRSDVAASAGALTALAARLAAVEAALGLPPAVDALPDPPPPADAGGGDAAPADVAALQTVLAAYADARSSLAARVGALDDALTAFAPALRRARVTPPAAAELMGTGGSRADLDRLQKWTAGFAGELASLELRVAAAEDALDAFFGTVR